MNNERNLSSLLCLCTWSPYTYTVYRKLKSRAVSIRHKFITNPYARAVFARWNVNSITRKVNKPVDNIDSCKF
jgi:hypothetical protein